MQFRLRTLGIIVAWFAVAFAIGKAGGAAAGLLFVGGSAFVAPAFIQNVWIRVGTAVLMAMVATDIFGLAFEPSLADDPATATGEHFMRAIPATIVIGALAATVSSGIRWIVVTSYCDFAVKADLAETEETCQREDSANLDDVTTPKRIIEQTADQQAQ